MGRILLGVVIGIILVIWLLVSCMQAIFYPPVASPGTKTGRRPERQRPVVRVSG